MQEQEQKLKKQEVQEQELKKQEVQEQEQELKMQVSIVDKSEKMFPRTDKIIPEAELGDFDDNFTWSAMVLASQGKKINQISIDEITWLTKLRKGLEET